MIIIGQFGQVSLNVDLSGFVGLEIVLIKKNAWTPIWTGKESVQVGVQRKNR